MTSEFDVFLSHNNRDKPMVRKLARALRARGIRVWLDEEQIAPGSVWQKAVEDIIKTTRTAAVLIGKDGLGPWEEPEMRGCLSQRVKRNLCVIPVLLPDAPVTPDLPPFLEGLAWVDLRQDFESGMDTLEWGITGKKPNRKTRLQPSRPDNPAPFYGHRLIKLVVIPIALTIAAITIGIFLVIPAPTSFLNKTDSLASMGTPTSLPTGIWPETRPGQDKPSLQLVSFTTTPVGANLYIDQGKGESGPYKTPYNFEAKLGNKIKWRIERDGYLPRSGNISITTVNAYDIPLSKR